MWEIGIHSSRSSWGILVGFHIQHHILAYYCKIRLRWYIYWKRYLLRLLSFFCRFSRSLPLAPAPIRAHSLSLPHPSVLTLAHSRSLPHPSVLTPAHSRTHPCSLLLTPAHSCTCWCTNIYGRMTKAALSIELAHHWSKQQLSDCASASWRHFGQFALVHAGSRWICVWWAPKCSWKHWNCFVPIELSLDNKSIRDAKH